MSSSFHPLIRILFDTKLSKLILPYHVLLEVKVVQMMLTEVHVSIGVLIIYAQVNYSPS